MTELKPCPFCEGEAHLQPFMGYWAVGCTDCSGAVVGKIKEEAIEAWNTRANPWHTGTPTEEGLYLVYYLYQPIPNSEEKEALYHQLLSPNSEDGYIKWVDIDGEVVFGEEEVIRWQKIEPYKEENNGTISD